MLLSVAWRPVDDVVVVAGRGAIAIEDEAAPREHDAVGPDHRPVDSVGDVSGWESAPAAGYGFERPSEVVARPKQNFGAGPDGQGVDVTDDGTVSRSHRVTHMDNFF